MGRFTWAESLCRQPINIHFSPPILKSESPFLTAQIGPGLVHQTSSSHSSRILGVLQRVKQLPVRTSDEIAVRRAGAGQL